MPIGREWLSELKLDGFRGVLVVNGDESDFFSKNGRRMRRFADLAARLRPSLHAESAVLDGELVVIGKRGPDVLAPFRGARVPSFAAFDLLDEPKMKETPHKSPHSEGIETGAALAN